MLTGRGLHDAAQLTGSVLVADVRANVVQVDHEVTVLGVLARVGGLAGTGRAVNEADGHAALASFNARSVPRIADSIFRR